jgi:Lrp/AsnC family transcriptional regulator
VSYIPIPEIPTAMKLLIGAPMLDSMDIKILAILQDDSTLPVAEIGKKVGLSTTPCWRRIQKLEQDGVIERRVALLNPTMVSAGVTVFVAITTNQHNSEWLERFYTVVKAFPEIVEAYRMSGQVDYMLRVVVPDIASYDRFYKAFISQIELTDVSSSFAMEQIKFTTALPLSFAAASAAKRPANNA